MNAEKGHSQSADNSQLLAHKSSPQGGHAFKLKAPYKANRRPATGDYRACERVQGRQSISDFTRGYGFWKNFYDGKCDSAITEADTCHHS